MADAKFMELLKKSEEERFKDLEEADREDYFQDVKGQAEADIRKGKKAIRNLNSAIRDTEHEPSDFNVGDLADLKLQLKVEEEKVEIMKEIYKDFFNEDFTK